MNGKLKTLLIRSLSGIVYVALIVSMIYLSKWTGDFWRSRCYTFVVLMTLCVVGLHEYYSNLKKHGVKVVESWGYVVAVVFFMTYGLLFNGFSEVKVWGKTFFLLGPFFAVLLILQLWRKGERPFEVIGYTAVSALWIVIPFLSMFFLVDNDRDMLMFAFVLVWVNDSFAYLTGMLFGKHRMWERHSPNKTWEGTLGGVLFCMVAAFFIENYFEICSYSGQWVLLGLICSVVATLGDLVESMFKRSLGIKDTGRIMPGHGGVLDRFDSMLMVMPFVLLIWLLDVL